LLPDYLLVDRVHVMYETFPITINGKLDKCRLVTIAHDWERDHLSAWSNRRKGLCESEAVNLLWNVWQHSPVLVTGTSVVDSPMRHIFLQRGTGDRVVSFEALLDRRSQTFFGLGGTSLELVRVAEFLVYSLGLNETEDSHEKYIKLLNCMIHCPLEKCAKLLVDWSHVPLSSSSLLSFPSSSSSSSSSAMEYLSTTQHFTFPMHTKGAFQWKPYWAMSRANRFHSFGPSTWFSSTVLMSSHPRIGSPHPRTQKALKRLWKVNIAGQCVDSSALVVCFHAEPLTSETSNEIFPTDWLIAYVGSHACAFVAVDITSGRSIWTQSLPARVESSAALSRNGRWLYVGCYNGGLYRYLSYCIIGFLGL